MTIFFIASCHADKNSFEEVVFLLQYKTFCKKKQKKFTLYRTKHFLSPRYVANYTNNYPTLNSEMKTLFTVSAFAQQETNFFQHQWERSMEEKLPGQSLVVQFCRGRREMRWKQIIFTSFFLNVFAVNAVKCGELFNFTQYNGILTKKQTYRTGFKPLTYFMSTNFPFHRAIYHLLLW